MLGLLGEYEVSLDAKGRMKLPAGFKKQLADGEEFRFVLNRGFEKQLTLYTEKQWEDVAKVYSRLNDNNAKARKLKRVFLNGATILEPDSAGRILLPKTMLEFASIKKSVVFTAQLNKVELWDADLYRKQMAEDVEDLSALAGEVLGNDFMSPLDPEI